MTVTGAMSRSESVTVPPLSPELAQEILSKTLEELQSPENVRRLEEARGNVGNEMLKTMQFLFPVVVQAQIEVLRRFGYPEGREGVVRFCQMLRTLERDDPEVSRLHGLVKGYYMPPVAVHAATNDSPAEEKTSSS